MDFAVENGVYVCTFAADDVIIQFERLAQHRDGLKAELTIFAVGATDDPNVPLHQAEMRLNGTNARRDVARYVAGRSLREVDWTGLIETAAVRVLRAYREGDPPILLREAVAPPNSGLLLPPLVRDGEPTILFGDGSVGKSMLALAIALSLHADRGDVLGLTPVATKRVLYLDWEANDWTQRDRMQRLIGEPMPDVLYRRCVGSLRDQVEPLKKMIRTHRVGFLVIDSVALAAGIEPETADAANGFFDALAVLGVGAICVAHVTKSAIEQDKPFGSIFWHNGARSTWLVKKVQEHSSNVFSVGLFNKKNNNGPLHAPLGMTSSSARIERRSRGATCMTCRNSLSASRCASGSRLRSVAGRRPMPNWRTNSTSVRIPCSRTVRRHVGKPSVVVPLNGSNRARKHPPVRALGTLMTTHLTT